LPLDRPQRVPITDQSWLRYFEELEARTGTTDTDFIAEMRLAGSVAAASGATSAAKAIARDRLNDPYRTPGVNRDPRVSRHEAALKELVFMGVV
jgi:hypothetical protein